MHGIFERFRGILHEGEIDKRVQYMIEGLFAVYKTKFAEHPAVHPDLDLVESEDQFTHEIGLNDDLDKVRASGVHCLLLLQCCFRLLSCCRLTARAVSVHVFPPSCVFSALSPPGGDAGHFQAGP